MASPLDFSAFLSNMSPDPPSLYNVSTSSTDHSPPPQSQSNNEYDPSGSSSSAGQRVSRLGAEGTAPGHGRAGAGGPDFSFDPSAYGLDPSAFQLPPGGLQFSLPSFIQAGPAHSFSAGPAVYETLGSYNNGLKPMKASNVNLQLSKTPVKHEQSGFEYAPPLRPQQDGADKALSRSYSVEQGNPVYGRYGSSFISVNHDYPPIPSSSSDPRTTGAFPPESPSTPFDPATVGLPSSSPENAPGLYSASGFDLIGVLARVAARVNPQINIGPVDTSCSFVVADARKFDFPVVFASSSFLELTGYDSSEIIGRNCRFLQAPGGDVRQGSQRRHTDSKAVWHLKSRILDGKESQTSVVNYRKNGTPFINLITLIPVVWDSDEIAYFVGFQMDLVDQPNAILERMRNGTYVVNYSLLAGGNGGSGTGVLPPRTLKSVEPNRGESTVESLEPKESLGIKEASRLGSVQVQGGRKAKGVVPTGQELLGLLGTKGVEGMTEEATRRAWYELVLDNSEDLIHVVSLKGALLYVSPSCKRILGYDEADLISQPISTICHPSDTTLVMRELKESGNAQGHPIVSLLYRAKRKDGTFVWLESQGKLYVEQGKGRKCVILVGRERPPYTLKRNDLLRSGGYADLEFWSKLSLDGMCLYASPSVQSVLGFTSDEMVGTAFSQLSPSGNTADFSWAVGQAASGTPVALKHQLKNRQGKFVDVVSNFFPNESPPRAEGSTTVHAPTVICQIKEAVSDGRPKLADMGMSSFPILDQRSQVGAGGIQLGHSNGAGGSGFNNGDNTGAGSNAGGKEETLFVELETNGTSSWQFQLNQLQLTNKRLREEVETLELSRRKRKRSHT